jgi:hypothetical protein
MELNTNFEGTEAEVSAKIEEFSKEIKFNKYSKNVSRN